MMHPVYVSKPGLILPGIDSFDELVVALKSKDTTFPRRLGAFKPQAYLKDRRVLKAISLADAVGLAALEQAVAITESDCSTSPDRRGMFVGAPIATCTSNRNYLPAVAEAARCEADAPMRDRAFAAKAMEAHPMTLLTGLPNNVLCYGAIRTEAKGANSNYTSGEVSGHHAMWEAAKRIMAGRLDQAFVGGFSMLGTDQALMAMFREKKISMDMCDGGVFMGLSSSPSAFGQVLTCKSASGRGSQLYPKGLIDTGELTARCLLDAGRTPDELGSIFISGHCAHPVETQTGCFGTTHLLGNLMEASGLLDIALGAEIRRDPKLAKSLLHGGSIDDLAGKPLGLVITVGATLNARATLVDYGPATA